MTTHEKFTGYDLAVGKVTGLRGFKTDQLGRLTGITFPKIWRPGENTADCNAGGGVGQRCGKDSHGCGLWAYHDGSTYDRGDVQGVIEGWGKTTIGSKGFRCEKARIVALCLPRARKSRLDQFCYWLDDSNTGIKPFLPVVLGIALGGVGTAFALAERPALWPGLLAPSVLVLLAGLAWLACVLRVIGQLPPSAEPLDPTVAAKIRRNYPDVQFFDSVDAMKAAYPVDPAVEPSPDNDPDFWERDASSTNDALQAAANYMSSTLVQGMFSVPANPLGRSQK